VPLIPKKVTQILEMHALALTLGHACSPIEKLQKSLGAAIASRMRPRRHRCFLTPPIVWRL
jgi:hypothetical protein